MTLFDDFLVATFGDELERFLNHPQPPPFIRCNTLKSNVEDLRAVLPHYGVEAVRHPGVGVALELREQRLATEATGFVHHFAGAFVKQSLGSMLPPLLLDAQPGEKVLDMCASPGSKTTQLAAMMNGDGELWANEVSGVRMNALAARVDASGAMNIIMQQSDGQRLANLCPDIFDRILVDAPCTGLGDRDNLRHARARFERAGRFSSLPDVQYSLLLNAMKMLRVGGRAVYSTCSLTVEENEAVLDLVLRRLPVRMVEPPDIEGLVLRPGRPHHQGRVLHPDVALARRIVPWENPSEGFFVAILEKTDELRERHARASLEPRVEATLGAEDERVGAILANIELNYGLPGELFADLRFILRNDSIMVLNPGLKELWGGFFRAGSPLAKRRGSIWRLSHSAIQRWSSRCTKHVVHLRGAQLEELARTGECDLKLDEWFPYPVLWIEGLGAVASGMWDGERLRWKRARAYWVPEGWVG